MFSQQPPHLSTNRLVGKGQTDNRWRDKRANKQAGRLSLDKMK